MKTQEAIVALTACIHEETTLNIYVKCGEMAFYVEADPKAVRNQLKGLARYISEVPLKFVEDDTGLAQAWALGEPE